MLRGCAKFSIPTGLQWGAGINHILSDAATIYKVKGQLAEGARKSQPIWEPMYRIKQNSDKSYSPYDSTYFVDENLTVSRKDYRLYRNASKELQLGRFAIMPALLGIKFSLLPTLYFLAIGEKSGTLGVNLTRGPEESYESALIRRHADIVDENRVKYAPQLNRALLEIITWNDLRAPIWKTPYDSGAAYHHIRNLFFSQVESGKPDVSMVPEIGFWCKMGFNSGNFYDHPSKNRAFYKSVADVLDVPYSWFGNTHPLNQLWSTLEELPAKQIFNTINDLLQDDVLIKRDGGTAVMDDEELLVSCLERGIARVDENLSRDALRKRLEDWLYLSEFRLPSLAYVAWSTTYHWEAPAYDDTDPWKDVPNDQLTTAFPELAVAPLSLNEANVGSLNAIVERGSVVPQESPDMDPFIDLQPSFAFSDGCQKDCFETIRENYLRSDDGAYRVMVFKTIADCVADGAPEYVRNQTAEVQKAIITAATHNLLLRGPNTKRMPTPSEASALNDVAGISPAAAAVLSGSTLTDVAQQASNQTWELPATFVHEVRNLIIPEELFEHPNSYLPKGVGPHAIRTDQNVDFNQLYSHPDTMCGQRGARRGGCYVLEPSFVSPRVRDYELSHSDAPVKRSDI